MGVNVWVYGFPPKMTEEEFRRQFFREFDESVYCEKLDYKGEKIFAFVHTYTMDQANEIIAHWNNRKMENSGEHLLQVRLKNAPNDNNSNQKRNNKPNFNKNQGNNQRGIQNNFRNQQMNSNQNGNFGNNQNYNNRNQNNFGNQNYHHNGNFQNNSGFQGQMCPVAYVPQSFVMAPAINPQQMNQNSNRNQAIASTTTLRPTLYVYGFPKGLEQEQFNQAFMENHIDQHTKTDFFPEKLYAFVHMKSTQACDELMALWDGEVICGGHKPLQVRYKATSPQEDQAIQSMNPILWVYGFSKTLSKEDFAQEFFAGFPTSCSKIDYFQDKLYAFVHCKKPKQCQALINRWNNNILSSGKMPIQVRFKEGKGSKPMGNNPQNQAMGDFNQGPVYNQTFGNNGNFYNNNANNMQQMQFQNSGYNQNMNQNNFQSNNFQNQNNWQANNQMMAIPMQNFNPGMGQNTKRSNHGQNQNGYSGQQNGQNFQNNQNFQPRQGQNSGGNFNGNQGNKQHPKRVF